MESPALAQFMTATAKILEKAAARLEAEVAAAANRARSHAAFSRGMRKMPKLPVRNLFNSRN